jgi:acetyl esterase
MTATLTMTEYKARIDRQTWDFIAHTGSFYPDDTTCLTIADQRVLYDRLCRAFNRGRPDGVTSQDDVAGTVPCRFYSSRDGTAHKTISATATTRCLVVYFHGGGFVLGGLDSHDDICAELCADSGFDLAAVDYRLAPEHRHPAMFDDAVQATRHFIAAGRGPVILCGDSAGGNLAAAVAHKLRGETDRIIGQVLIYPSLGPDTGQGSYAEHAQAPMLSRSDMQFYLESRCGGAVDASDTTLYPLADTVFSNLPPTIIITAECDPLSDDGRCYRDAIQAAGGQAAWIEETGLVHGFLRARGTVDRAAASFNRISNALRMLGSGNWTIDGQQARAGS